MIVNVYPVEGTLRIRVAYFGEPYTTEVDRMLLARYDAGDVDVFEWPFCTKYRSEERQLEQLAEALYDEREMGHVPPDCNEAQLPDGRILKF